LSFAHIETFSWHEISHRILTILLKRLARDFVVYFITVGAPIYGAFGRIKGELIEDSGRTITVTQEEMTASSLRAAE
jgi:hypothetical protein